TYQCRDRGDAMRARSPRSRRATLRLGLATLLLPSASCTGVGDAAVGAQEPQGSVAFPATWRFATDDEPARSERGMVVTTDELASEVGARVLGAGGNAVDAAIAVQFALAVVNPEAGNIGGGGFMVVRMADGTAAALDFREK